MGSEHHLRTLRLEDSENGGQTIAEPDKNTLTPEVRALRVGGKRWGGGRGGGHLYTFKVKSQFESDTQ